MDPTWQHNPWGPWRTQYDQSAGYFSEDVEFSRAYHSDRVSFRGDHSKRGKKKSRWDEPPQNGSVPQNNSGAPQVGFVENLPSVCNKNQNYHASQKEGNNTSSMGNRPLYSNITSGRRGGRFPHGRGVAHQSGLLSRQPHNGLFGRPNQNGLLGGPPRNGFLSRPPQNGFLGRPPFSGPLGRPPVPGRQSPSCWGEEDEENEISHWLKTNQDKLPCSERDQNPNKDPLPGSEEERNNALKKATELLKQSLKKKKSVNLNELLTGDQSEKPNQTDCHGVSKLLGQPKNLAQLELNENDMRLIGRAQPAKEKLEDDDDDIIEVRPSPVPSPHHDVIDLEVSPVKLYSPDTNLDALAEKNESESCPQNWDCQLSLDEVNIKESIESDESPSQDAEERNACHIGDKTANLIADTSSSRDSSYPPIEQEGSTSSSLLVSDAIDDSRSCKISSKEKKDCLTVLNSFKQSSEKEVSTTSKVLSPNTKKPEEVISSSQIVPELSRQCFTSPSPKISQRRRSSVSVCISPNRRSPRSSPIVTPNASRQNKIISDLQKISQTKLRDLINNPRSGKLDFAMQQLIKEHRTVISQKSRESAEKMIPAQNLTPKPDIVADDRSVLADLSIDWNSLPTELIDTLGDLFNIESGKALLPSAAQDVDAVPFEDTEMESRINVEEKVPIKLEKSCEDITPSIPTNDNNSIVVPSTNDDNPTIEPLTNNITFTRVSPTNDNNSSVVPPTKDKLNEQTPVRIRVAQFARENYVERPAEVQDNQSHQIEPAELPNSNCSLHHIENRGLSPPLVNLICEESRVPTSDSVIACQAVVGMQDGKNGRVINELPEPKNKEKKGKNKGKKKFRDRFKNGKKKNKSTTLVRLEERSWFDDACPSSRPVEDVAARTSDPESRESHTKSSSCNSQERISKRKEVQSIVSETSSSCESVPKDQRSSQGEKSGESSEVQSKENENSSNLSEVPCDANEICTNEMGILSNESDVHCNGNEVNSELSCNANGMSSNLSQISSNLQTAVIMPIMCMTVSANANRTIVDKMTETEIQNRLKEIDLLLQNLVQEKCLLHDALNNLKSGVEPLESNQQNKETEELPPRNSNTKETEEMTETPERRKRKLICSPDKPNASKKRKEVQRKEVQKKEVQRKEVQRKEVQRKEVQRKEEQSIVSETSSSCERVPKDQRSSQVEKRGESSESLKSLPSNSGNNISEAKNKSSPSHTKNIKNNSSSIIPNVSAKNKNLSKIASPKKILAVAVVPPQDKEKQEELILAIKIFKSTYFTAHQNGTVSHYQADTNVLFETYGEEQAQAVNCLEVIEQKGNDLLFAGGEDGFLRVFNILPKSTAKFGIRPTKSLNVTSSLSCLAYNWDTVFIGTKAGCIVPYNVKEGKLKDTISLGGNGILSLLTVKEGPRKVIIVGSRHQPISVRDADSGLLLRQMGTSEWSVYSLSFYNNMVFCGADRDNVAVFDFQSGKQKYKLGTGQGIIDIVQAEDVLFCACYDGNIYCFDLQGQCGVATIKGPGKMILCIAIYNRRMYCSSKSSAKLMVSDIGAKIQSVMDKNSKK